MKKKLLGLLLALCMIMEPNTAILSFAAEHVPAANTAAKTMDLRESKADKEIWDGSISEYLTLVDPSKDYDGENNPIAITSGADLAYLSQQSNAGITGEAITYKVGEEEKTMVITNTVVFKQTKDIYLNDETFTMNTEAGVIVVTDGVHTGYLGTGLPGTRVNKKTPTVYGTWYTKECLTGTLTPLEEEEGYKGKLNVFHAIGHHTINNMNTKTFKGTYDGNGYVIQSLYANADSSFLENGLFGNVSYGTIKNVTILEECLLTWANTNTGGLAAYSSTGTISNCYVEGIQIGKKTKAAMTYHGGIIGYSRNTVEKCAFKGFLGQVCQDSTALFYMGGIVGFQDSYNKIQNCYNRGTIWCADTTGKATVAGIAGRMSGNVSMTNCYTAGIIGGSDGYVPKQIVNNKAGNGAITNCFYDEDFSKQKETYGEGKGAADIKAELLNQGLIESVWEEDSKGTNGGYPILKEQHQNTEEETVLGVRPGKDIVTFVERGVIGTEVSIQTTIENLFFYTGKEDISYECSKVYKEDGVQEATEVSMEVKGGVRKVSTTPTTEGDKTYVIPVTATAEGKTVTSTICLQIEMNQKPVLTGESKEEGTLLTGHTYSKYNSAIKTLFSDKNGDTLTYEMRVSASGKEYTQWETLQNLSYIPEEAGTHKIEIRAYDGYEYSDVYEIVLEVSENHVPTLKKGVSASVKDSVATGLYYEIQLSELFEDEDNDTLWYKVSIDGGNFTNISTAYYKTQFFEAGTHTLTFHGVDRNTVSYKEISTSKDSYTVTLTVNKYGYQSKTWTGAVDTTWYDEYVDEFHITTPAQLAGLAAIVNGTATLNGTKLQDNFEGKTIYIDNDIALNSKDIIFELNEEGDDTSRKIKITDGNTTVYTGSISGSSVNNLTMFYQSLDSTKQDCEDLVQDLNKTEIGSITLRGWKSIGSGSNTKFMGTFDGQGHTISGLYTLTNTRHNTTNVVSSGTSSYAGLFGYNGGTIQNVTVDGCVKGYQYVGAVAGYTQNGTIINCTNKAVTAGYQYAAGIVGYAAANSTLSIKNTKNDGSVIGKNTAGIVGYETISANAKAAITESSNRGTIIETGNGCAGIVGYISGASGSSVELSKLVNEGTIKGNIASSYCGGIFSDSNGTTNLSMTDCYNRGRIEGVNYAGGLAGRVAWSNTRTVYNLTIHGCYTTGDIVVEPPKSVAATASLNGAFGFYFYNAKTKAVIDLENIYYMNASYPYDVIGSCPGVSSATKKAMKKAAFVAELSENYVPDYDKENDGYPVFAKEDGLSKEKEITSFAIGETKGTIDGTKILFEEYPLNAEKNTVSLTPTITISEKATIDHVSGEEMTFTQSDSDETLYTATCIVTAENGSARKYTVSLCTKAAVTGVSLDKTEITVIEGYKTETLTATVAPANAGNKAVTWTSADETIATVDENGVVTGLKEGTTTITVTTKDQEKSAECKVTVKAYETVNSIELPVASSVKKNEMVTLNATVLPETAANKDVTWTSEDETIAKVDEDGVVTGLKEGYTTITATAKDERLETSVTATCIVTVEIVPLESISISPMKQVAVGKKKQATTKATPADASVQDVIWESSDEAVATVDKDGVITGIGAGSVTITATAVSNGDIKDTLNLQVVEEYSYDVQWTGTFNVNEQSNAVVDVELPTDASTITESWSAEVGNGTAVIVGDYLYTYMASKGMDGFVIGGETGTFYKVDKETGEVVDKIADCPGRSGMRYSFAVYGDGMIYVGTSNYIMAFDIDTFTMAWASNKGNGYGSFATIQYINGFVMANGKVLDATTGALVKDLEGEYDYCSGGYYKGYYYIADYVGKVYAFNATTWQMVDSYEFKKNGDTGLSGSAFSAEHERLYWADGFKAEVRSIKVGSDGKFIKNSYIATETTFTTVCSPVICGDRVYVGGQGTAGGTVAVFDAETLEQIYIAKGASEKVQSTPIVTKAKDSDKVYVYVQEYKGSTIYVLEDSPETTSGELKELVTPSITNYAYEQLTCDADGALYCTNDTGNYFKFQVAGNEKPQITKNLDTECVTYVQNEKAEALQVEASVADEGVLSYQWQTSSDGKNWTDVKAATESSYTPSTETIGTSYYRCMVTSALGTSTATARSDSAMIRVISEDQKEISVKFRLIGATLAEDDVDFKENPGEYNESEYVTWVQTTEYKVKNGMTVKDLFKAVMEEEDLAYEGLENNLISSITAPEGCGGYTLATRANGVYSMWMFTVNGETAGSDIAGIYLAQNDEVVFYYVNDYRYEEKSYIDDYSGDDTYVGKYLEAEDTAPFNQKTEDKKQAKKVISLIEAIGEVTLEKKEDINKARTAYDALTEDQKALVSNIEVLETAETAYQNAVAAKEKADAEAAAKEEAEKKAKEEAAKAEAEKKAQEAIRKAELEAERKQITTDVNAAISVIVKIMDMGTVDLGKESKVKAARAAYNALTAAQKSYINADTVKILTKAEKRLVTLEKAVAKGKQITVSGMVYKVTRANKTNGTVQFVKMKSLTAKTIKVPATVKLYGRTYKVTSVATKAFANCKKVTKITLGKNVEKIGAKAFKNCKKLKTVVIQNTKKKASLKKTVKKAVSKKVTVK